jgi:hypothetical protein
MQRPRPGDGLSQTCKCNKGWHGPHCSCPIDRLGDHCADGFVVAGGTGAVGINVPPAWHVYGCRDPGLTEKYPCLAVLRPAPLTIGVSAASG